MYTFSWGTPEAFQGSLHTTLGHDVLSNGRCVGILYISFLLMTFLGVAGGVRGNSDLFSFLPEETLAGRRSDRLYMHNIENPHSTK